MASEKSKRIMGYVTFFLFWAAVYAVFSLPLLLCLGICAAAALSLAKWQWSH
jgi:hypothetical protein